MNIRFVFLFSFIFALESLQAQPSFMNVANQVGNFGSYSSLPYDAGGMSFRDYDNDGWDDLTYCTGIGSPIKIFKNNFGIFEEVTTITTNTEMHYYSSWLDYDNDNDLDLFTISSLGGVELFQNNGSFSFTEIANTIGFAGLAGAPLRGATFGDFNNDGLVDVYICSYNLTVGNKMLFQNPNHSFQDVTIQSGTQDSLRWSFMGVALDYNDDGWMDLYIANDGNTFQNTLFKNNGDTTFTDVSAITGTNLHLDAMGMALGDYDGDLDLDIHITDKLNSKLLRLNSNSTYSELASQVGVDHPNGFGWGTNFFDADLDGDEDLYISCNYTSLSSEASVLCVNNGQGIFSPTYIGDDSTYAFTNVIGDFNNDRLQDIAVLNSDNQSMNLWKNTQANPPNRFSIKIKGCITHADAAGSKLIAYDGADARMYSFHISESFLGQNSDKKVIPILNNPTLDSLKVIWPTGAETKLFDIKPDQTIIVSECEQPKPLPVILVPNYATQGLTSCSGDPILLELNGNYENVIWSTGDTINSIYVTSAGIYDVTVTNQFGVSATSSVVTIQSFANPQYTITTETPSCFDNGWVEINPIDSNAIYTYHWSNGLNSNYVSNLNVGTYSVSISINGQCEQVETVVINQPQNSIPIQISATVEDLDCYNDNSGSIELEVNGGTPPFHYLWTNQVTSSSNQLINAGNYGVTATDANGCEKDTSFSVEQPDQILAFIDVVPDTNLMGAGSITLDIIGGTPPYTVVWSDSLNQTGEIASNLVKGAYTAKITDSQFCERLLNIVVPNVTLAGLAMITPQADKLECLHIDGNIHIQLDRAINASDNVLESIFIYDVSGRKIAFDYTAVANRTLVLSFNASGVFILRDEFTQQSCKVIKL